MRWDIKMESVERSRDVENGTISGKQQMIYSGPIVQTPPCFLENEDNNFKT
jgi:hypothetical protein